MSDEKDHLQAIWNDIRDDIKKKTDLRSSYAIQYILALAAIVGAYITLNSPTVSSTSGSIPIIGVMLFLFTPPISIYYTFLIMETFDSQQHQRDYLKKIIEPRLAELNNVDINAEWETYFSRNDSLNLSNITYKTLPTLFVFIMWVIYLGTVYIIFTTDRVNIISDKFGIIFLYLYLLVIMIFCIMASSNAFVKLLSLLGDCYYWIANIYSNWRQPSAVKPKEVARGNLSILVNIVLAVIGFFIYYIPTYFMLYVLYIMFMAFNQITLPTQGNQFHFSNDMLNIIIWISNNRLYTSIPVGLIGAIQGFLIWNKE